MDACRVFVLRALHPFLQANERHEQEHDYKTQLQELCQARYQAAPLYEVVGELGPAHDRTFEVVVSFAGQELGRGEGKSKKEAEQQAAAQALRRTPEPPESYSSDKSDISDKD